MPRLYKPTPTEALDTLNKPVSNFPELRSRAKKAADLILLGHIDFDFDRQGGTWKVYSQDDVTQEYIITGGHCTCPDYQLKQAPQISNGAHICKHILAVLAYKRILTAQLRDRLVGNMKYDDDNLFAMHHWNAALIRQEEEPQRVSAYRTEPPTYLNHHYPEFVCNTRYSPEGAIFASDKDAAQLAMWLDTAQMSPPERDNPQYDSIIEAHENVFPPVGTLHHHEVA